MDLVKKASLNVLKNGFRLRKGETFVAVSDRRNKFFSDALEWAALKIGAKPKIFILEDFGKRPVKCPKIVLDALRKADAGTLCATGRLGELETLNEPIYNGVKGYPVRFASMTGINREAVEIGLNCNFKKVERFTNKVFAAVKNCKNIIVTTGAGTDLTLQLGKYRWVNCNGVLKKGVKDDNYPEGEVMTAPADANGKIVVDGVMGDIYDFKYGLIAKTPLTIYIKEGEAQKKGFYCKNKNLEKDIFNYIFKGDKYSKRVGEVALGTNICLKKVIGNLLQDEKFPSFHLAFGDPFSYDTGAPWKSNRHIDLVILKPDVSVDGKWVMKKGKYLI